MFVAISYCVFFFHMVFGLVNHHSTKCSHTLKFIQDLQYKILHIGHKQIRFMFLLTGPPHIKRKHLLLQLKSPIILRNYEPIASMYFLNCPLHNFYL